jgi:hypothetical protein
MTLNLEQLTVTRFRVGVELAEPMPWSPLVSWVIGGAFGAAVEHNRALKATLFKPGDAHPVLFETHAPDGVQDISAFTKTFPSDAGPFSVHDLAHHLVLAYARHVAFDTLFIGDAAQYARQMLSALWRLQAKGLGRYRYATESRVAFRIVRVAHVDAAGTETVLVDVSPPQQMRRAESATFDALPPTFGLENAIARATALARGSHLRLDLLTPLHLRRRENDGTSSSRQIVDREPTFGMILLAARRRLLNLLERYPNSRQSERPTVETPCITVPNDDGERWDYRYWVDEDVSSLSGTDRRVRGVVGRLVVPMPAFESLLLLAFIEQIHLGKDAIRGLGRIRLVAETAPSS